MLFLISVSTVLIAGALLSYFFEPIYISSVSIGQSHIASKTSITGDEMMRAIHERVLPLSNKLMDPFQVNKVSAQFYPAMLLHLILTVYMLRFFLPLIATCLCCANSTQGVSTF